MTNPSHNDLREAIGRILRQGGMSHDDRSHAILSLLPTQGVPPGSGARELEEARAACTRYKGYLPTVIKELEGDLKMLEEGSAPVPTAEVGAKVRIGKYLLSNSMFAKPLDPAKVWIETEDGEGGEFETNELEKLIGGFYDENF